MLNVQDYRIKPVKAMDGTAYVIEAQIAGAWTVARKRTDGIYIYEQESMAETKLAFLKAGLAIKAKRAALAQSHFSQQFGRAVGVRPDVMAALLTDF